ncbi:MAG: LysM peptidoglycan-binding domain-containing protein [Anaerolineae bacterium]|nr:LysM peptidoglycan-binding domain-containing protein [Anaerolineae bacterium]
MCGAVLKEQKKRNVRLPTGDLMLPLLLVLAVAVVWVWRPWQIRQPQAMAGVPATDTPNPSPTPTAAYTVAPTATPLASPTPSPTPTLPPNQTVHVVKSGEVITNIAKQYGTTAKAILTANSLKENTIIKPGQQLIIPLPVADIPTPTPTIVPSPTPVIYVVKANDTLGEIATRFNTTTAALMKANGITDATTIYAGARLVIVQPGAVPTDTPVPAKAYEVRANDTLFDIAVKFGVTVEDLKKTNGLKNNLINVGQQLTIPTKTGEAAAAPTATPEASQTSAPALGTAPDLTGALAFTQPLTAPSILQTPVATWTPTPGPDNRPVELLAPADEATFEGPGAVILLNWASMGILDEDEWYVVRLRWTDSEEEQPLFFWTKVTSWRMPANLYVSGLDQPQRWRWRVLVVRRTGVAEDGTWIGEEFRPASNARVFYWK